MPQSRVFTDADLRKKKTEALPEGLTPIPDGDYDHSGLIPLDENDKPYDTVDLKNHQTPYTGSPNRVRPQNAEDPSLGEDVWNEVNRPHLPIFSEGAKKLGEMLPGKNTNNPHLGYLRGLVQGGLEGAGGVADNLTSDLGLLTTAIPFVGEAAPGVAPALSAIGKAASVPFALHGGKQLIDPKSTLEQRGQGLFELAGGLAGTLHTPHTVPKELPVTPFEHPVEAPAPAPEPTQSNFFQTNENGDVVPGDLSPVRPINPSGRSLDTEFAKPIKWKNQPIIENAADNDPKQLGIFDEKPGWTGNAKQIQLGDAAEPLPVKPEEPVQQGFNLEPEPTPLSNKFKREFGPVDDSDIKTESKFGRSGLAKESESAFTKALGDSETGKPRAIQDLIKKEELDPHEADTPEITALKDRLRQSLDKDYNDKVSRLQSDNPPIIDDHGGMDWEPEKDQRGYTGKSSPELEKFHKDLQNSIGDEEDLFPKHMRATDNPENVALGGTSERGLNILGTTLYSEDRPTIAAKELLQNAVDEHRISGTKAPIKFLFHYADTIPNTKEPAYSITIGDKGRGVTKDQIYTVLTNMFESGKADEAGASGGFGIAKAAPMMGGKYARFESVVNENGKKIKYTFEGSPAQLKNQKRGVPVKSELMPQDTPTGLRARVYYDKDTHIGYAKNKVEKMAQHSIGNESPIEVAENYSGKNSDQDVENYFNDKPAEKYSTFENGRNIEKHVELPTPQLQETLKLKGADVNIHYDTPDENSKAQELETYFSNNGLHQFEDSQTLSQHGALRNVPSRIKFDIKPTVAEGEEGYPFTANREQLQKDTHEAIKKWVNDNIISGALEKQKQTLKDMYDNMQPLNTHGTGTTNSRPVVLYDPNNTLTPEQHKALTTNPFIMDFADTMGDIIHNALEETNGDWSKRIEKTGITLDPTVHGIWIPNPEKRGSATILINPFINISRLDPLEAARENLSTGWHEVGHTGHYGETTGEIDWSNVDTNDPEIGPFFQKYMNEVAHASRVSDGGHQLDWLRHTAEVYAKAGTYGWNSSLGALHDIFTGGKPGGGYTPEVQNALQIYLDRERAAGTGKDILSGTGVNSDAKTGGKKSVFSNAGSNGARSTTGQALSSAFDKPIKWEKPTKEVVNQVQREVPQQEIPNRIANISKHADEALKSDVTKDEKETILEKATNFQRTLLTSYDMSAPGRQGLPLIWHPSWWKSFAPMVKSWGSAKAYQTVMDSIKNDPSGLFRPDENGISFANQAKLELTDALSHREEVFRSQIAEKYVPGVAPSVRAYTAYMNKLRADTFKSMVKSAGAENNLVDATKIADFVNVATGRGSLGAFEGSAKALSQVFFAPRLMGSRIQMYQRTLNPYFYAQVPSVVRQAQLKSAIALAGTGLVMGQLSKMIGAEVNTDPTNSDFGKIRLGKTRIDPFAGHQQYLVGAARLLTGKSTSSTTDKTTDMNNPKYGQTTRQDIVTRFMGSKLAPVPSFVWDWMAGTNFDGTPFDTKQAMEQRIVPIVMQDLHDIWKEDPALLPGALASASAFGGFGVQTYGR